MSLAALNIIKITTSGVANDKVLGNMTFPFQLYAWMLSLIYDKHIDSCTKWHIQMHFLDIRISADKVMTSFVFYMYSGVALKSRSCAFDRMTLHFPCHYRGGLTCPEDVKKDMKSEYEMGEGSSSLW